MSLYLQIKPVMFTKQHHEKYNNLLKNNITKSLEKAINMEAKNIAKKFN